MEFNIKITSLVFPSAFLNDILILISNDNLLPNIACYILNEKV